MDIDKVQQKKSKAFKRAKKEHKEKVTKEMYNKWSTKTMNSLLKGGE